MPNPLGKTGGGGMASAEQEKIARKERLRQLALEKIDLGKDPYFMRNHLGTYECKLCLTLHGTEANYLVHTQGRKHQTNVKRRANREKMMGTDVQVAQPSGSGSSSSAKVRKPRVKIGRPGYTVTKQIDPESKQLSLLFMVEFPEIEEGLQPRHRFMSAFEQRIEPPDKRYQFLLVAADPYETIGFKIPNREIDKEEGKFVSKWDAETKKFTVQFYFKKRSPGDKGKGVPVPLSQAGVDDGTAVPSGVPVAGLGFGTYRPRSEYNPMVPQMKEKTFRGIDYRA